MIRIIAEIGINWQGNLAMAAEMIRIAKECGADVAKFQVYDPVRLLDPEHPTLRPWWDVILSAELSEHDVECLKGWCDEVGIEFLASIFHPDRVEWLERIGVREYKIGSRSLYDEELAAVIKATGKPVIRSWGYFLPGKFPQTLRHRGLYPVTELYCTSQYPTPLNKLRLPDTFGKMWGYSTFDGFSDHTIGILASVMAMCRGAMVIEKHFTLDRDLPGPDHICSIEPNDLRRLCNMRDGIEVIHNA